MMTTVEGQEEVTVLQQDLRIQETALTVVQSDALLDSSATPDALVSETPDTDNDPLPGTSETQALASNTFTDIPVTEVIFRMFMLEIYCINTSL